MKFGLGCFIWFDIETVCQNIMLYISSKAYRVMLNENRMIITNTMFSRFESNQ